MTYRYDIDGLRAIAVLAVLLFHLGFSRFAGGFVGVDMFFVISGFLITSILEQRHEKGTFRFVSFYLGRVRRLLPALFVTIAFTFIASAVLMTPDDFTRFARSAIGAVLSVSNFVFFAEAGYWDTASDLKPLLHTWSLGVEEQFYLIWPIFLVLVFGPLRRFAGLIFAVVTIAGLGLTIWATEHMPSAAFYWSPFRVFEFSLGAWIIYIARWPFWQRLSQSILFTSMLFATGLALCGFAILTYDSQTVFPGVAAIWPCLGTALIILAGSHTAQPLLKRSLELGVVQWIGRISYSMYLVHWPIIALYRYETGHELVLVEQLGLAAATLLATLVLYYGVEQRFRKPAATKNPGPVRHGRVAAGVAVFGIMLTSLNAHAYFNQGWLWRVPDIQLTPEQIEAGKSARFDLIRTGCRIDQWNSAKCDRSKPVQVLVIGNSHEPDGFNFLAAGFADNSAVHLIHFGTLNRCADLKLEDQGWRTSSTGCEARVAQLRNPSFTKSLSVVVHSSRDPFGANKQVILDIMSDLKSQNPELKVVTIGGYITTELDCARLINEGRGSEQCRAAANVQYFADQESQGALFASAMALSDAYIDRVALLCRDRRLETCLTETPDGIPLMYDGHHLSREFAEFSGRLFAAENPEFFESLLGADVDGPTAR